MIESDNPLADVVASSDRQNGVDPTPKKPTLDLNPMPPAKLTSASNYEGLVADLSRLLEDARRVSARAVNTVMTATYWEFGRRIVEFEQRGEARAGYGEELLRQLARDLTKRLGRGFSVTNLQNFRTFFLNWPIHQTVSGKLPGEKIHQTVSGELATAGRPEFPLPWSHYVRLMAV